MLYLLVFVVVVVLNIVPVFMPPTWTVLAFFSVHYGLNNLVVVLIGVLGATIGRIMLYLLARNFGRKLFSVKAKDNFDYLGKYLNTNRKSILGLVIIYAFIPLPSNQLFITAGLAKVNIYILSLSFVLGRLISYSLMLFLTHTVLAHFRLSLSHRDGIILEALGFVLIYIISKISWKDLIGKKKTKV